MTFTRIDHGSPEYWKSVELRQIVLRTPLGLSFSQEELAAESGSLHLVATQDDEVLACLILVPLEGREIKMRQVAVDESRQGQGLGRALVEFSEQEARRLNGTAMTLHARKSAVPFYEKLGYQRVGDEFLEVGIPHFAMIKSLG